LPSGFVAVPQPYRNGNVITIRRRYGGAVDWFDSMKGESAQVPLEIRNK
jgi:hypothetical protein